MDLSTAQGIYLGATGVQSVYFGSTLIWPATQHDYSHDYLTFTSLEDNNDVYFVSSDASLLTSTISVSTDDASTWTNYVSTSAGTLLATLNQGDKLLIKGNNNAYSSSNTYGQQIRATASVNVSGNIMSLIYGDNFANQTNFPASSELTFEYLFHQANIIDASNLILPATTLVHSCYASMFMRNRNLIKAPVLPATILTQTCYFRMFYNCSSLNYIKCLATDISASNCLTDWVYGVSSSGTFIKDASTTWPTGNNGIPTGWTSVDAA